MSTLLDTYPQFNNLHTVTQALGLAVLDKRIYYLSTAGPGVSCKSIWSSLVSSRGSIDCTPWGADLMGADSMKTLYQSLPNTNFQHMVSLCKSLNFLIVADPAAAQCHNERDREPNEARKRVMERYLPAILSRFADYVNTQTNVPIVREWAPELWQAGLAAGGITPLDTYGDCVGAWMVTQDYDWLSMVQTLLHQGHLIFPAVS